MGKNQTADEYILNAQNGKEILLVLRDLIRSTGLTETIKWGAPVYTIDDKNVVGLGSFKSYTGLWFYQGSFLKDEARVLVSGNEGVTKALRQWRFTKAEEIDDKLVIGYINEAIENTKQGKALKPDREKPLYIPGELQKALESDHELNNRFNIFSLSFRREFAGYVAEAKRAETREKRVQKIIPMIMAGSGLNDKYQE